MAERVKPRAFSFGKPSGTGYETRQQPFFYLENYEFNRFSTSLYTSLRRPNRASYRFVMKEQFENVYSHEQTRLLKSSEVDSNQVPPISKSSGALYLTARPDEKR